MNKKYIIFGLFAAMAVAGALSLIASQHPDGLERVAEDKGFLEKGEGEPIVASPMPDYVFPRVKNEKVAASLAGIFGTAVVFGAGYGLAVILKRKSA